jgi:signal peptidase I
VAVPEDTLEVKSGALYVNGMRINEPYLNGTPQGNYGPFTVPTDSVFVMGDNRNNSEDSRAFGALKKEFIVGQALLVYWPFGHVQILAR